MSEMLHPVWVKAVEPTDMSQFGIRFKTTHDSPTFIVDSGQVWKSACWVCLYDDGRIVVWAEGHLTHREMGTVRGLAERTFTGGSRMCRYEKWERLRKTTKRRQGFYRTHFYIVADDGEMTRRVHDAALNRPPVDQIRRERGRAIERQIEREDAA